MASPYGPMRLIANPAAGRGRHAVLGRLRSALEARGLDHDLALSTYAGQTVELAREAVEADGIRFVVAVGGDGTVHEVVNGMVDPATGPRADGLVLGVVPAGSGSDFARTFDLDRAPAQLAARLDGDAVRQIDVGTVACAGRDGLEKTVCFANIAEVGYGAVVVDAASRCPRWVGGLRYLYGVFAAIREFGLRDMRLVADGEETTDELSNVVVANCRFFGGNMHVAPNAEPDSGDLAVQLWRGKVSDVVVMTPKIKKGRHLDAPMVRHFPARQLVVRTDEPVLVEADGEVLGTTPATFGLLRGALALKV